MCSLIHLSTCPQSHMVTHTHAYSRTQSLSLTHNHTHAHTHKITYTFTQSHTCTQSHTYTVSHTWLCALSHTHCLIHSQTYSYTHMRIQLHAWEPTMAHTYAVSHTRTITHASLMHMHTHVPHTVTYWKPHMAVSAVHTMAWKSDPLGALGLESESFVSLLCCLSVDYSRRNEGPTSSGLVANIDKGEIQSKSLIIEKSRKPHSEHLCCFYLVSSNTMLRGLSSSKV